MTDSNSLTPLDNQDYDAIENAVMETARGRWFLAEYAKKHRSADTEMLLSAITKLERNLKREGEVPNIDSFKLDIADMANAIERTKKEIAQIADKGDHGDRFSAASGELDAIVEHTETATQEILNTAELVQELSFEMREASVDEALCDRLEEYTTNIYMACSFQDLTGQRTQKVVHVLRYLENRVNAMIDIWHMSGEDVASAEPAIMNEDDTRPDAHLLNGPQTAAGEGVDQDEIDSLLANESDQELDANGLRTVATPADDADPVDRESGAAEGADPSAIDEFEAIAADDAPVDEALVESFGEDFADDLEDQEDIDLASFEAEALQDREAGTADEQAVAGGSEDPDHSLLVENDLEFASSAADDAGEEPAERIATSARTGISADDEADIFETASEASPDGVDLDPLGNAGDDFEGADVFERPEAMTAIRDDAADLEQGPELSVDDLVEAVSANEVDPTLDLTTGERLALFH